VVFTDWEIALPLGGMDQEIHDLMQEDIGELTFVRNSSIYSN
tara:strand:- start:686 stop:811 length:126 start_codon:yes stop_codon:yes gene_type:complete